MKRRTALQGMITAGLLPASALAKQAEQLAGLPEIATTKTVADVPRNASLKQRFAAALEKNPALLGYRSVEQLDQHTPSAQTRGRWPAELRGSFYRNGPGRHEIGDFRYQHWFDGDGLLQAWHLNTDGKKTTVEHHAKLIRTRKFQDEQAAGRALYPGFGTLPPNSAGTPSADHVNPANISVLHHHNKLFALWEAGSPYEMHAQSIATIGEAHFSGDTAGVPFSAHPRVEPDGNLWNFGYVSDMKKLVLWHLSPQGEVVKTALIDCDPISMVHDFVVTERHLVILVCPLHYEPMENADNFLDLHRWHPEGATQVLVVDKNDLNKVQRLELPAQWVFHFSNAWEDAAGVIRFEAASTASPKILDSTFRDLMGGVITPSEPSELRQYRIDTRSGTVSQDTLRAGTSCEFPVVGAHTIGKQHNEILLMTEANSPHSNLNQVSLLSPRTGIETSYRYADHVIPEEHVLIGTPNSNGKLPWVLGTALNYKQRRTELHLFASGALADGPIASAWLPYALPLGLHGKFVESV